MGFDPPSAADAALRGATLREAEEAQAAAARIGAGGPWAEAQAARAARAARGGGDDPKLNPRNAWPFRGLDHGTLDR